MPITPPPPPWREGNVKIPCMNHDYDSSMTSFLHHPYQYTKAFLDIDVCQEYLSTHYKSYSELKYRFINVLPTLPCASLELTTILTWRHELELRKYQRLS